MSTILDTKDPLPCAQGVAPISLGCRTESETKIEAETKTKIETMTKNETKTFYLEFRGLSKVFFQICHTKLPI